jgi:serine/threonine-protein kinase OSR1/STK39
MFKSESEGTDALASLSSPTQPLSPTKGLVNLSQLMRKMNMEDINVSTPTNKFPTSLDHYNLIEQIGVGTSQSTVWSAYCPFINKKVAIKKIDMEKYPIESIEKLRSEVGILSSCKHGNIVSCKTSFIDGSDLYVVMDLLDGGSVFDVMRVKYPTGIPNEEIIATILKNVLGGLQYFHSTDHVHCDIKLSNVLLGSDGRIQIGDVGMATPLMEGGHRLKARLNFVGSFCWMAPEVLSQTVGLDCKADIWSLGMTALELAYGDTPFINLHPMEVMMHVLHQPPPQLEDFEDKKWSKNFHEFVSMCLVKEPEKRPDAATLLKHKFFSKTKSDVEVTNILLEGVPTLAERVFLLKTLQQEIKREEDTKDQKTIKIDDDDVFQDILETYLSLNEEVTPRHDAKKGGWTWDTSPRGEREIHAVGTHIRTRSREINLEK